MPIKNPVDKRHSRAEITALDEVTRSDIPNRLSHEKYWFGSHDEVVSRANLNFNIYKISGPGEALRLAGEAKKLLEKTSFYIRSGSFMELDEAKNYEQLKETGIKKVQDSLLILKYRGDSNPECYNEKSLWIVSIMKMNQVMNNLVGEESKKYSQSFFMKMIMASKMIEIAECTNYAEKVNYPLPLLEIDPKTDYIEHPELFDPESGAQLFVSGDKNSLLALLDRHRDIIFTRKG